MHHIIFNPVAGKGRASAALSLTLEFLSSHGVDYQLHTTREPSHATLLAAATPPGSTVIAMGGDGTVHEVVKGLLHNGPKIGGDPATSDYPQVHGDSRVEGRPPPDGSYPALACPDSVAENRRLEDISSGIS